VNDLVPMGHGLPVELTTVIGRFDAFCSAH
jgi:hypothetical protein